MVRGFELVYYFMIPLREIGEGFFILLEHKLVLCSIKGYVGKNGVEC